MGRRTRINELLDKIEEGKIDKEEAIREFVAYMDSFTDNKDQYKDGEPTILSVGGKPFRCSCGANVFTKNTVRPELYRCNGCEEEYTSE
jgi:hypothetical protein